MLGGQSKTPARGQAQPGQDGRLATAAGASKLTHHKGRAKGADRYLIQPKGIEPFTVYAKGRDAWALVAALAWGSNGDG